MNDFVVKYLFQFSMPSHAVVDVGVSVKPLSHFSFSLGAHFSQICSRLSVLNLFAKAN